MSTNVSPPNSGQVTIVTATLDDGSVGRVHVIPNRGGLMRLAVGFDSPAGSALRTLGEVSRPKAQALLDALQAALDATDENGVQR